MTLPPLSELAITEADIPWGGSDPPRLSRPSPAWPTWGESVREWPDRDGVPRRFGCYPWVLFTWLEAWALDQLWQRLERHNQRGQTIEGEPDRWRCLPWGEYTVAKTFGVDWQCKIGKHDKGEGDVHLHVGAAPGLGELVAVNVKGCFYTFKKPDNTEGNKRALVSAKFQTGDDPYFCGVQIDVERRRGRVTGFASLEKLTGELGIKDHRATCRFPGYALEPHELNPWPPPAR